MTQAFANAGLSHGVQIQPIAKTADPRNELRWGVGLGGALLIALVGWGGLAQLDAAVIVSGVVRAGGSLIQIQTPTGGVITRVYVANGARVSVGAPLVDFTSPAVIAQERSLASQVFALQAEIARLDASLRGESAIGEVAAFVLLTGEDRKLALAALSLERAQLVRERSIMSAEASVVQSRRTQIAHQAIGQSQRRNSSELQKQLNDQELATTQSLLDQGLTTRGRVIALQRAAAAFDGEIGASQAEVARLNSQSQEVRLQLISSRQERARANSDRLRSAQAELQTLLSQWQSARADRSRAIVRAPFSGTVSVAAMPQAGNVVQAGAALFDLVPSSRGYVVEAQIPVGDASELARGQTTQVRLLTLHSLRLPPLTGKIERISANSIQDPRTGTAFYTAEIHVSDDELRSAEIRARAAGGVRPGTPVEVTVPTRSRTALEYLVEPLLQRIRRTFSER